MEDQLLKKHMKQSFTIGEIEVLSGVMSMISVMTERTTTRSGSRGEGGARGVSPVGPEER